MQRHLHEIVVVDDDVSVCRAFSRLLKSCGFDVRTYTSTESFFDAETPCDKCVLILDIRMPGIDGLEVQDIIRKTNPATPIVFVTAHEDEEARTRALDGGARAFLRKPVNEEDLLRAVNEAMGGVE